MDDRLRDLFESAIEDAVKKNFDQVVSGNGISSIMQSLEDAIASERIVPAVVIKKSDNGMTFITTPEILLNKTVIELRDEGLIVPDAVPDCARVRRIKSGQLVFVWNPIQIINADDALNS